MNKKLGVLGLLLAAVMVCASFTQCAAQEDLVNARLTYSNYFNPMGINYNDAVTRFGDNDAATACYMSQMTNCALPRLNDVFIDVGRNWFNVMLHFGVDPTVLYVPVPTGYVVGPPYGNAYGYYNKHMANPSYRYVLTSADVVNLTNLNIIHKCYNTPVVEIMNYRTQNKSFNWISGNEYKKHSNTHYNVHINQGGGNKVNVNGNNGNWNNQGQGGYDKHGGGYNNQGGGSDKHGGGSDKHGGSNQGGHGNQGGHKK